MHGNVLLQVGLDLLTHPLLGCGQAKWQALQQLVMQAALGVLYGRT